MQYTHKTHRHEWVEVEEVELHENAKILPVLSTDVGLLVLVPYMPVMLAPNCQYTPTFLPNLRHVFCTTRIFFLMCFIRQKLCPHWWSFHMWSALDLTATTNIGGIKSSYPQCVCVSVQLKHTLQYSIFRASATFSTLGSHYRYLSMTRCDRETHLRQLYGGITLTLLSLQHI